MIFLLLTGIGITVCAAGSTYDVGNFNNKVFSINSDQIFPTARVKESFQSQAGYVCTYYSTSCPAGGRMTYAFVTSSDGDRVSELKYFGTTGDYTISYNDGCGTVGVSYKLGIRNRSCNPSTATYYTVTASAVWCPDKAGVIE